jgi:hypothetical protein
VQAKAHIADLWKAPLSTEAPRSCSFSLILFYFSGGERKPYATLICSENPQSSTASTEQGGVKPCATMGVKLKTISGLARQAVWSWRLHRS